jgi:surface polysaccharide O-acyltransferase-like enzyme
MPAVPIPLKRHLPWADTCRTVAIFGVILLHSASPVFYNGKAVSTLFFCIAMGIDSLTRISVPLLLMLSGALLLQTGTPAEPSDVFRRVARVGLPLIFWSLVYALFLDIRGGKSIDVPSALMHMAREPVMFHLAFIYVLIGVYIFLPFLKILSDAFISNRNLAAYFFGIWLLINALVIYFPFKIISSTNLVGLQNWGGFFLLGAHLRRTDISLIVSKKMCLAIYLGSSAITFAITWMLNRSAVIPVETAFEYLSPNVIIAAAAVFVLMQKMEIPASWIKPMKIISGLTFPIYFMHVLVMGVFGSGVLGFKFNSYSLFPGAGIIGLAILTFSASLTLAAFSRVFPRSTWIVG